MFHIQSLPMYFGTNNFIISGKTGTWETFPNLKEECLLRTK